MIHNQIQEVILSKIPEEYLKSEYEENQKGMLLWFEKMNKSLKIRSKDIFLIKIVISLISLAQAFEMSELGQKTDFNVFANRIYFSSKNILKRFEKPLGRESLFSILQAVREYRLCPLGHENHIISRIVFDSFWAWLLTKNWALLQTEPDNKEAQLVIHVFCRGKTELKVEELFYNDKCKKIFSPIVKKIFKNED